MISQLVESLPYIRTFSGKTIVVKLGGAALHKSGAKDRMLQDVAFMHSVGIRVVVVHGGGKEIDGLLGELGRTSRFIGGYRATPPEDVGYVEMVLSGKTNKDIVSRLNMLGVRAVGLSGKDGAMVEVERQRLSTGEDLGSVGRVIRVHSRLIETLLHDNFIPVISCVASFYDGETANVNADELAAHVAISLSAIKLMYVTDVDGLTIQGSLVDEADLKEAQGYLKSSEVSGGMLPKLEFTVAAIQGGVQDVHMINGTVEHSLLTELFTTKGIGSKFTYVRRHS